MSNYQFPKMHILFVVLWFAYRCPPQSLMQSWEETSRICDRFMVQCWDYGYECYTLARLVGLYTI